MENIYIDESGSMTAAHCAMKPFFIICLVKTDNPKKVKTVFKRFVSSRMEKLRHDDKTGNMFMEDEFLELKGSSLTPSLKRDFVKYMCRNNHFEIFYIRLDNKKIASRKNGKLYQNTARAFNYVLKLALEHFIKTGFLSRDGLTLQLDERNEKTKAKYFLENYLNTELFMNDIIDHECKVQYFDSANNSLIQIADVFANLYLSNELSGAYEFELQYMREHGYLKKEFYFPLH